MTLGDPGRLTGGYLYHRRMADAAASNGATVRFESVPERAFPVGALDGWRVVAKASRGVDAMLVDSIAAAFVGPALAARERRVPIVGVLHQLPGGMDHGPVRTLAQRPLDLLAYGRARLLIVASGWLADELVRSGVPGSKLRVVPPGRDVAPPPSGSLPDLRRGRAAALVCVANWMRRKGILELLAAFARVPAPLATLHLAGDEAIEPAYARRVRERLARADLADRVVRHGALSREGVGGLYAAADAFALPAFVEPYGTVWGEAMAAGLPVVGWRAGNLPYLARDGVEALMAGPGDVDGLARILTRLAEDEALRARIGAAARERASSNPTWEESARMFFDAIRGAVGDRTVARR